LENKASQDAITALLEAELEGARTQNIDDNSPFNSLHVRVSPLRKSLRGYWNLTQRLQILKILTAT